MHNSGDRHVRCVARSGFVFRFVLFRVVRTSQIYLGLRDELFHLVHVVIARNRLERVVWPTHTRRSSIFIAFKHLSDESWAIKNVYTRPFRKPAAVCTLHEHHTVYTLSDIRTTSDSCTEFIIHTSSCTHSTRRRHVHQYGKLYPTRDSWSPDKTYDL